MVARNLATWAPPEGMAKSLQSAGAEFDLVYGWDYSGPILDHIKTSNRQGLTEVYKMALNDPAACGIIRAKRPEDGALVGTVVLYNMQVRITSLNWLCTERDGTQRSGYLSYLLFQRRFRKHGRSFVDF